MNKWSELLLGLILVILPILIAFYSTSWILWGVSFNFWTPAWWFLKGGLFWMIFGIGAAVNVPAFKGVFSHNLDRGKFDSEWGLWDGMSYFFWGISAFIGGYIAKIYGFEILFFIMLCLSVIGLIISTRLFFIKKKKWCSEHTWLLHCLLA